MSELENTNSSIFDHLHDPFAIPRKQMLPRWMKFFCYFFLFLSTFSIIALFFPSLSFSFFGMNAGGTEVAVYGLHAINEFSISALLLVSIFLFKAVVSYALLAEKDWAIKLAMVDGALGILICCITMLILPFFGSDFNFSWELLFLLPYQARLWRMRPQWTENSYAMQQKLGLVE